MFRVLRPEGELVLAIGSGPPPLSLIGIVHYIRRSPEILLKLRGRRLTAPGFLDTLVKRHFPESDESEETLLARRSSSRTQSVPGVNRKSRICQFAFLLGGTSGMYRNAGRILGPVAYFFQHRPQASVRRSHRESQCSARGVFGNMPQSPVSRR